MPLRLKLSLKLSYLLFRELLRSCFFLLVLPVTRRRVVVVYSMGKVGSSAIEAVFGHDTVVVHVHRLALPNIWQTGFSQIKSGILPLGFLLGISVLISLRLRSLLGGEVFFVSPVRCPYKRNVSAFFQILELRLFNLDVSFDYLLSAFLSYDQLTPSKWFEEDFFAFSGFCWADFNDFDNWISLESGNFKYVIFKAELGDDVKCDLLNLFLKTDFSSPRLQRINEASGKWYSHAQLDFVRRFSELKVSIYDLNSQYCYTFGYHLEDKPMR